MLKRHRFFFELTAFTNSTKHSIPDDTSVIKLIKVISPLAEQIAHSSQNG